jgi:hypothetical protein
MAKTKIYFVFVRTFKITLKIKRLAESNDEFQLKRQKFGDIPETKPDTQAVSNSVKERDFKRCFQQWERRCTICVHPVGAYFEGKNTTSK